jgi:hypothetical protein
MNKVKALVKIAATCGKGVLTMAVVGANVMSLKKCITKSAATLAEYDHDIDESIKTLMGKSDPVDIDVDIDD